MRCRRPIAVFCLVLSALGLQAIAGAAERHAGVVEARSIAGTPQVVATTAVPIPHVDAIALSGDTVFAGGLFDTIVRGTTRYPRVNMMAFHRSTGAVSGTFRPRVAGGQVMALATDPQTDSVYVGGTFRSVNGVARAALAKLDGSTGALDTRFRPPFTGGQINDLDLVTVGGQKRLLIGGSPARRLMSLDPATGADDRYLTTTIGDAIPGAWRGVEVYQFAVDPSRSRLVATGNFQTVDGQPRTRLFMLDLGSSGARLSPWYYPGFAKPCATDHPRRIAYLQGVDWSPDGTSFSVAATGQIPASKDDIWYQRLGDRNKPNTTVCDAVGRFSLFDDSKPTWINYTGGDSVWSVADTGPVVYAAGHFRWFDNPDGHASLGTGDKEGGTPAAARRGIAAISVGSGLAHGWNPGQTATRIGGKAFVATSSGLWIGNDATRFAGAPRYGLAFAPLP